MNKKFLWKLGIPFLALSIVAACGTDDGNDPVDDEAPLNQDEDNGGDNGGMMEEDEQDNGGMIDEGDQDNGGIMEEDDQDNEDGGEMTDDPEDDDLEEEFENQDDNGGTGIQ